MDSLAKYTKDINDLMARYGVKFGVYKNQQFHEQLFPFDSIPCIIGKEEFLHIKENAI